MITIKIGYCNKKNFTECFLRKEQSCYCFCQKNPDIELAFLSDSITNLAISMLHEALHAKLIAEFYDDTGSTDFKKLFKYYKDWDLGDIDKIQERQMFQDYLDELASALQIFDRDQNIIRPLDFYVEALKYDFSYELDIEIYREGYEEYLTLQNDKTICH